MHTTTSIPTVNSKLLSRDLKTQKVGRHPQNIKTERQKLIKTLKPAIELLPFRIYKKFLSNLFRTITTKPRNPLQF